MLKPSLPLFRHLLTDFNQSFLCRETTWDAAIVDSVFARNEYQIGKFEPADIIFDVGAHIGSFSRRAHYNGSRRVHSFEVNPENQYMCNLNFSVFHQEITLHPFGFWRNDRDIYELRFAKFYNEVNTGGGCITEHGDIVIEVRSFDLMVLSILQMYQASSIRFLKLDCEGSEFPILMTSKYLDRVQEIAGEFHLGFTMSDPINGKTSFTLSDIEGSLKAAGFSSVEFQHAKENNQLGYFRAIR